MAAFDTSGEVGPMPAGPYNERSFRWGDLSPFAQGYVEALLLEFGHTWSDDNGDLFVSFSDLSPEALAMILRDCEAWTKVYPKAASGQSFWRCRQEQLVKRPAFPPLRVYLNDAGKVCLEVAK